MNDPITFGRPFVLQRDRDVSDVSGTGIIADGVLFPDGHAAIHWRGKWPLTTPHPDGLESILAIHDHGGRGDLHVIWPDVVTSSGEFGADLADMYNLPVALLGTRAERAYLHRQVEHALRAAASQTSREYKPVSGVGSIPGPIEVEGFLPEFVDAVMPITAQLQDQRDKALRANGRAYELARTWKNAHGSAMFLVRAAGTELSDVLAEEPAPEHDWYHPTPLSGLVCRRCDLIHKFWSGEACVADEPAETMAAVECSAEYHGPELARPCMRAAQHHGDHIDEHGFHWSDTVAVYPIGDGEDASTGPLVPPILMEAIRKDEAARTRLAGAVEVRDPCPHCEDSRLIPRTFMSAHIERHHPDVTVASHENGTAAATEATLDAEGIEPSERTGSQRLLDALLHRGPGYEIGANDRQACPYCPGGPMILRRLLEMHIEVRHASVLAALASGVSLDELLHNAMAAGDLPHEMED